MSQAKPKLKFEGGWDYAPAPESTRVPLKSKYELFINGRFVAPKNGRYFRSVNPATGKQLARIAKAETVDVNAAVRSARRAYEKIWGPMPGSERGKYLFRIARIIQENARGF